MMQKPDDQTKEHNKSDNQRTQESHAKLYPIPKSLTELEQNYKTIGIRAVGAALEYVRPKPKKPQMS